MSSRRDSRREFEGVVRMGLLEDDVDHLFELHAETLEEARKHTRLLVGVLVSVCTACILMAVNVLVMGAQ